MLNLVKRWTKRMYFLFLLAITAYAIGTLVLIGFTRLVSDSFTPVALMSSIVHLTLFPALVFLPLCLLLRQWRLAGLILPIVLMFVWSYAPFFKPHHVDANYDGPSISALTFNIFKRHPDYHQISAHIRQTDADIVAVQELGMPAASILEADLSDLYPYIALYPRQDAGLGQGFLSKYPILEEEFFWLSRAHLRLVLDVNGQQIVVYNIHIVQPLGRHLHFGEREWELGELLQRAKNEQLPVLWMGDFNMTDQSDDYGRVVDVFKDAFREAGHGFGFTYPAPTVRQSSPMFRLDYVFYGTHFDILEAKRLDSAGSDHHPIFVRLRF